MNHTKQEIIKQNGGVHLPFNGDPLSQGIRFRIRGVIEELMNEELDAVLGAGRYERTEGRRGHRNGSKARELTTSFGKTTFERPRAVLFEGEEEVEYQSAILDRYRRRSREVDAALLGMYFGGVNTRKVKQAIRPLLKNAPLSKSAISRLIQRLKEYFEAWRTSPLKGLSTAYLYLDGIYVRVRCGGRTRSLPVLAVVGIRSDGEKVLLALDIRGGESEAAWKGVLESLIGRGLQAPKLLISDGSPGLTNALDLVWPGGPAPAVRGAQVAEPLEPRAEGDSRGDSDGLPRHRLRGGRGDGPDGLRGLPAQVAAVVGGRSAVPGGRRGGTHDVLPVSEEPVEGDPDDQPDRTDQPRVSPAGQNAGLLPHGVRGVDRIVRLGGLRHDPHEKAGRV